MYSQPSSPTPALTILDCQADCDTVSWCQAVSLNTGGGKSVCHLFFAYDVDASQAAAFANPTIVNGRDYVPQYKVSELGQDVTHSKSETANHECYKKICTSIIVTFPDVYVGSGGDSCGGAWNSVPYQITMDQVGTYGGWSRYCQTGTFDYVNDYCTGFELRKNQIPDPGYWNIYLVVGGTQEWRYFWDDSSSDTIYHILNRDTWVGRTGGWSCDDQITINCT